MTREEAIAYFEKILAGARQGLERHPEEGKRVYGMRKELSEIALAALRPIGREQVERMSGEWVHEPNKRSSLFYCSSCGESFNIHSYEVEKYGFCPYCGIPMTDNAVDMVMERLEVLTWTSE